MTHLFCQLHHIKQLGIDLLLSFSEYFDELFGLFSIGRGEEGIRSACSLSTSCSPNTMHIILSIVRKVKIDNIFDIRHICKMKVKK